MKHFIGGYEVSAAVKLAYERSRQGALDEELRLAAAIRRAGAKPCRQGWNVVCHCAGPCEKLKEMSRDD